MNYSLPQRTATIIVDMRCLENSSFRTFKSSFVDCCQDVCCVALMGGTSGVERQVCLSLLLLRDTGIEAVLRDSVLEQSKPASVALMADALRQVGALDGDVLPRAAVRKDKLHPLHDYLHELRPTHACLVLMATAYLSHAEVFHSLSGLCTRPLPYSLCCLLQDPEATCHTSADLGPFVRLHRCSLDPMDVRAATQKSLLPFFELSQRVRVRLLVGSVVLYGFAERPYVAELRRCCLPEDFPATQAHSPALVFQGKNACTCGIELQRHTRGDTEMRLEAVLSPADVDESYLYGDSWVVQPSEADANAGTRFNAFFAQFAADAMLFSSGSAALLSPHQLAFPRACHLCYFLDRSTLFCRQIIPVEMRRVRGMGGLRGAVDDTVREELQRAHHEVRERSAPVTDLIRGDVLQIASQMRLDGSHHITFQ